MEFRQQERSLAEEDLPGVRKSVAVAYLLWLVFGLVGGHRFYLGDASSGVGMCLLFLLGWVLLAAFVGAALLLWLVIWVLLDAFRIPGLIKADVARRRARHGAELARVPAVSRSGGR
jgi:TM2 domain-containing membrane protein YozV